MQTIQQFERLGASQPHCPGLSNPCYNLIANLPDTCRELVSLNCARAAVRPALERAISTNESHARVDIANKYSERCPEPNTALALMAPGEDAVRPRTAVDGRPIVYVVDGDVAVRGSLEALIRLAGWRCESSASAQDFLSKPKILGHRCLLLDHDLPDMTGLDLQKRLPDHSSEMPTIFLTRNADVRIAVAAMKAGAIDFLTKPCDGDVLLAAVRQAFQRGAETSDRNRTTRAIRERRANLSRREHEVMSLVVTGHLNKQIGFELGISEITVKAHRGRVMRKMGAKSLAGLVAMAGQIGLAAAPV